MQYGLQSDVPASRRWPWAVCLMAVARGRNWIARGAIENGFISANVPRMQRRPHSDQSLEPFARADTTVIFLHVGKTAGATLRKILEKHYAREERLLLESARWEETMRDFPLIPERERASARLIYGHLSFGIHRWVPQSATYITMLRDPVSRVVSQYLFVLRERRHRLHDSVVSQRLSLRDYIESGVTTEIDNGQTRMIAGDIDTPFGEAKPQMLERAKRNIEQHFAVVGLTERFEESLVLLKSALGWRRFATHVAINVSSIKHRDPIPDSTIDAIREGNRLDQGLYDYAAQRLEAMSREHPSFEQELARLRRISTFSDSWGNLTYNLPRRVYRRLVRTSR
jgi:galactose-3-O-sulfotransferase